MESKIPAVVIDSGSGMIKCGLNSHDLPTSVFPNLLGTERYEKIMEGSSSANILYGQEANTRRGTLSLKYPVSHGIVDDWPSMEAIWTHMYSNELRLDPSHHKALLTEAPLNPKENREQMISLFFDKFEVPAFYLGVQAVLSLYSAGKVTGVVFDSGDGVTHIVPTFEGFGLTHAIRRVDIAGRDVTEYLSRILSDRGVYLKSSAEMESVREMKEKLCYVALDYDTELKNSELSHDVQKSFMLPDGQEVVIGAERFKAPECMFQPNFVGKDVPGVSQSTEEVIKKCDLDIRRALYENIMMSGGSTMYSGIQQRLQNDLKNGAPASARVVVTADPQRKFSVWVGGKILSQLNSFEANWITSEEFQEYGPSIVHRKCF